MSDKKSPRLFLIDGYGFVFRAYHVLPPLTNPQGVPVGAVMGFANMLLRLLERLKAQGYDHDAYIAVVLDAGQKNFRHDLDTRYKANRPPAPDDLIPQFPLIREVAEAFNLRAVDASGFEADDIIATYARQAVGQGMCVTIVSSDKDLMQLVTPQIEMYDPVKDKRIGEKEVEEKFGVPPSQVREVLALMGDSSDNVPGVPGIGPKTAAELVLGFGTLENLYARIDEIKQAKRKETLIAAKADAFLSRELVGLCETAPVVPIAELQFNAIDQQKLLAFLHLHGFKSLIKRLEKEWSVVAAVGEKPAVTIKVMKQPEAVTTDTVQNIAELEAWLRREKLPQTLLAVTVNENAVEVAVSPSKAVAMPFSGGGPVVRDLLDFDNQSAGENDLKQTLEAIARIVNAGKAMAVGWRVKGLMKLVPAMPFADIELMQYALDGAAKTVPENLHAAALFALYQEVRIALFEKRLTRVYTRIDQPVQPVLAEIEVRGIKVDAMFLRGLSDKFGTQMGVLEKEIYALAQCEFNIGSPKQLGEVLFDRLGIAGGRKSKKTGAYGTDADILEALAAEGHTIAAKVLEWRGLSKLKSTYTDALPKTINPVTGRVHTTFNLAATTTGRLSSEAPNLQNIPIRSIEGKEIRKAFIAEPGNVLISADYSQIELRLLAHMADIPPLKTAFRNGIDIHTQTAAQVFGLKPEEVTSAQRRSAKAINFGIIYGQSAFGLASSLGIPREQAGLYIRAYFEQFPGIQQYMEDTKEFARARGYVETLFGRKCYTPYILDKIPARRQFGERAAINAPLQGTAADIIKKAMILLHGKADMVLQVHDELLIECPEAEAEKMAALVKHTMESAATLSVPLTVDVSYGKSWD